MTPPGHRPPLQLESHGQFVPIDTYFGNMPPPAPPTHGCINSALDMIANQAAMIKARSDQDSVNVMHIYVTATELIATATSARDSAMDYLPMADGAMTNMHRATAVAGANNTLAVIDQVKAADATLRANAEPIFDLQMQAHAIANRTGRAVDAATAAEIDAAAAHVTKQLTTSNNLVQATNTIADHARNILATPSVPQPPAAQPFPSAPQPSQPFMTPPPRPVYNAVPIKPTPDRKIWTILLIVAAVVVFLVVLVILIVWLTRKPHVVVVPVR